jgi:leucyl aminopeptidase
VQALPYYSGLASGLLATAYSYSAKTISPPPIITVALHPDSKDALPIISLANARVDSAMMANGRGDHFGSPAYFIQRSKDLAEDLGLGMTVICGDELKKEGLNLFHAVGRGSNKDPAMINLSYRGDSSSEEWLALIGKGICFDAGGLDLKGTDHLGPMFLDKSGACSCLAAL